MPSCVLCRILVSWEDFTSDDVFVAFFNRFSGNCWSWITFFLGSRLQTDLCLGIPVLVRFYLMKYAQDTAACDLRHPHTGKMFLGIVCFFCHACSILEGGAGNKLDPGPSSWPQNLRTQHQRRGTTYGKSEHEAEAWYRDAQRAEVWRLLFFTFFFLHVEVRDVFWSTSRRWTKAKVRIFSIDTSFKCLY